MNESEKQKISNLVPYYEGSSKFIEYGIKNSTNSSEIQEYGGTQIKKVGNFKYIKKINGCQQIQNDQAKKFDFTFEEKVEFRDKNGIQHVFMQKSIQMINEKYELHRLAIYGFIKDGIFEVLPVKSQKYFVSKQQYKEIVGTFKFPSILKQIEQVFINSMI